MSLPSRLVGVVETVVVVVDGAFGAVVVADAAVVFATIGRAVWREVVGSLVLALKQLVGVEAGIT